MSEYQYFTSSNNPKYSPNHPYISYFYYLVPKSQYLYSIADKKM